MIVKIGMSVITLVLSFMALTAHAQKTQDAPDILDFVSDRNPETQIAQGEDITDRIIARRIDVVDSNGVIRLTLAGALPGAIVDGIQYRRSFNVSGLMLRDDKGNERGGFGYNEGLGGPILALDHVANEGAGFAVRGDGEAFMFVGQKAKEKRDERLDGRLTPGGEAPSTAVLSVAADGGQSIAMTDKQGRVRLRLKVDDQGGAIEFLNADGEVADVFRPRSAE